MGFLLRNQQVPKELSETFIYENMCDHWPLFLPINWHFNSINGISSTFTHLNAFFIYGIMLFSLSHFEYITINWKKWFSKCMELCIVCFFNLISVLLECCHSEMNVIFQGVVKMPFLLEGPFDSWTPIMTEMLSLSLFFLLWKFIYSQMIYTVTAINKSECYTQSSLCSDFNTQGSELNLSNKVSQVKEWRKEKRKDTEGERMWRGWLMLSYAS